MLIKITNFTISDMTMVNKICCLRAGQKDEGDTGTALTPAFARAPARAPAGAPALALAPVLV